jgi:hypothetical protein
VRPRILGIDQPIRDEIIALMIRNEYSDGIGGGIDLNLTVNVPYRLTIRFPDESKGILEFADLRAAWNETSCSSEGCVGDYTVP